MPPSSNFNFACKDGRVTAVTFRYCSLVVSPTVNTKSSILNVAEFLDLSLKISPLTKTSPVLCENQYFILKMCILKNTSKYGHLYRKTVCFLCYFIQYEEVFLSRLLESCYHYLVFMDPVNGYSKSTLLVKE